MSGSSFAQAQAELARIDLLIRRAVILTQLAGQSPDDPLRGLYVSDDRTAALAARSFAFAARHQPCLPPGEQAAFDTAIRQARKQSRLVAQQARRAGVTLRFDPLRRVFGAGEDGPADGRERPDCVMSSRFVQPAMWECR